MRYRAFLSEGQTLTTFLVLGDPSATLVCSPRKPSKSSVPKVLSENILVFNLPTVRTHICIYPILVYTFYTVPKL